MADNLRSESMPPEGEPRPEPRGAARPSTPGSTPHSDRTARARAARHASAASTATEYNNTIRDLIGLDLRPADEFPADDVGYGFDNIGDVLATPPILVEMYLAAAETVIDAAFRIAASPRRRS